ncbi:diguanylate cyclase [Demequina sp. NBRC 110057]|uniref:GGDEF domain-containing protein n=1 Tax=Demequina sp. NBRC 110057 TaxID=1570346 RepID=UPI0009FE1552|nr:diguanylate cyclase [Demequina sp. NBRC 110057]
MSPRRPRARARAHSAPSPRTLARVAVIAGALVALQLFLTLGDAWLTTRAAKQELRDTYGYVGDVVETRVTHYVEDGADVLERVHAQVEDGDLDDLAEDLAEAGPMLMDILRDEESVSGLMLGLSDGRVAAVSHVDGGFEARWTAHADEESFLMTVVTFDEQGREAARREETTTTSALETAWYQAGATVVGLSWTEPYDGKFIEGTYVAPAKGVRDDGELTAVVAAKFEQQQLVEIIEDVPLGEGSSATVVTEDDVVVASSDETADSDAAAQGDDGITQVGDTVLLERSLQADAGVDWVLRLSAPVEALAPAAANSAARLAALTAVSLALSGLVVAMAIRYWRPARDALRRSATDPLTGLANRAELTRAADALLAAAHRDGSEVMVAALDLDRFKRLNDTHGHDAGDRAIVAVADALRSATRARDVTARTGGDEFVVVMRIGARGEPADVAERLRAMTATALADGVAEAADAGVDVTLGYALATRAGHDLTALLAAADEALVDGKATHKGRAYGASPATASSV